ncbi:MAG TPA: ATP-binding protein [Tepidisphaeraceae bacterium]|jgi:uncharacterized protein YPO0396|nr:ATP-binding protein [Tepidisphaeraceae bacterium]
MSNQQEPLSAAFATTDSRIDQPSFLLHQLEVFNWGPFRGLHRAEFDKAGTAIIGPTGSGKTTLVDALMTLLVLQPKYNLASTGGHESDRTLISYVRGVLGGDGSDGREEVARPGKTITGVCATYQSGPEILKLAALLWTDGSSNAAEDLKRRWIFSQADDQSLQKWLTLLHDDGLRDLMRMGRETAKLRIFENKKQYLSHTRKFFDVGENAFTLLNRAAGLKQLNSIDEIFRDLVLDDRSAFERALEVASEFDNLAGIHGELETARRQQASLVPIADEHRKLELSRIKLADFELVRRIIPIWYAIVGERLWNQVLKQITADAEEAQSRLEIARGNEKDCQSRLETLRERYLALGGSVIGELQNTIKLQEDRVNERKKHADDYRRMVATLGLVEELSEAALAGNQASLTESRGKTVQQHKTKHEETLTVLSQHREFDKNSKDVEAALRKVKDRPGSNIPPQFQDFRSELARQLEVQESNLPFLAELLEVKVEDNGWRGAIERAIGSDRLRILVPQDRLEAALRWINQRNNRLHVRLQRANRDDQPRQVFADSFARKLNFKPHVLLPTAQLLLANRDLHCVNSADALQNTEHGLTIEGMMSGSRGKFEKQDQHRLNEGWMTGFDNKDQLEALAHELSSILERVALYKSESQKHHRELDQLSHRLTIIDQLLKLEFATIDLPGAESDLAKSRERLALLLDPESDASQAKANYDAEQKELDEIRAEIKTCDNKLAVLNHRRDQAVTGRDRCVVRRGNGLTEEEMAVAVKELPFKSNIDAEELNGAERNAVTAVEEKLTEQQSKVAEHERRLVRYMGDAKHVDTGALADTGSELADIGDYLDRLRVLNEEALPEKLHRFLDYLNRSSDQGVTQLLAGITEEVDAIEQRISELNRTLLKVDFRSGRYLQLQPQRIKHERLRSLENAMRNLRSAALKDDQGESHYKALRELVEILRDAGQNSRQLGSKALLDPRYRLQFFVVEVDRQTGDCSPPRTGSQSGSGGEKELMASHILTASLSYALCPAEAICPLYATVVLDEAFSKSSPSAAGRIIEALRIFRLHPIFVTPNKEIGLLKRHTRRVICVQRPKKEASIVSISWEMLEGIVNP